MAPVSFLLPSRSNRVDAKLICVRWPVRCLRVGPSRSAHFISVCRIELVMDRCAANLTDTPPVGRLVRRGRRDDQCGRSPPSPIHIFTTPRPSLGFILVPNVSSLSRNTVVAVGIQSRRGERILGCHSDCRTWRNTIGIVRHCHSVGINSRVDRGG